LNKIETDLLNRLWKRRAELPSIPMRRTELSRLVPETLRLLLPIPGFADSVDAITKWSEVAKEGLGDHASEFSQHLPEIQESIILDAEAILNGDPAAKSFEEVVLAYPGFYASAAYRIAHAIHNLGLPLHARILSSHAHARTAIDIHPAAEIGHSICVDHGTGIVIGETTTIGNHLKLYQGVTLGALSVRKEMATQKRHPTIGNNVVIYANATLLGAINIGNDCVIGGNVWLTESVPNNSVIRK
jgi:serine O-acetyltransferase